MQSHQNYRSPTKFSYGISLAYYRWRRIHRLYPQYDSSYVILCCCALRGLQNRLEVRFPFGRACGAKKKSLRNPFTSARASQKACTNFDIQNVITTFPRLFFRRFRSYINFKKYHAREKTEKTRDRILRILSDYII